MRLLPLLERIKIFVHLVDRRERLGRRGRYVGRCGGEGLPESPCLLAADRFLVGKAVAVLIGTNLLVYDEPVLELARVPDLCDDRAPHEGAPRRLISIELAQLGEDAVELLGGVLSHRGAPQLAQAA